MALATLQLEGYLVFVVFDNDVGILVLVPHGHYETNPVLHQLELN